MSTRFALEHINRVVEITYTETQSTTLLRMVGRLQGFYDNGKGVQWWMVGRSTKRYATEYTIRVAPVGDLPARREPEPQQIHLTSTAPAACLSIEHLQRLIEISYTTADSGTACRISGRLEGFDESPDGLEVWMHGRSIRRRINAYTITALAESTHPRKNNEPAPIEMVGAK